MKTISTKFALPALLLCATIALGSFGPSMRIDHEDRPTNRSMEPAITLGPLTPSGQTLYVAFQDDSTADPIPFAIRSDIMFQKSTDAGRTWLPADVLVRRGETFATSPDIATDLDGNIYVMFDEDSTASHRLCCVRSSDGGATWSARSNVVEYGDNAFVGWGRIAADSAGNLFCAWNGGPFETLRIYTSASSDRGATWGSAVLVDDDSTWWVGWYHPDVFVQPGTNHYLVAAKGPDTGYSTTTSAYLYRSTDGGQTFEQSIKLDTFSAAWEPHVVADAQHVICDYAGRAGYEARTLYTPPDTWSSPRFVGYSYYDGGKLAISADGRVHMILLPEDTAGVYRVYYIFSSDHGETWSEPELVSDDTATDSQRPDIASDAAGNVYVVWRSRNCQVWFSTNNPSAGTVEQPAQPAAIARARIVSRYDDIQVEYQLPASARVRAILHDAVGRQVGMLDAGQQQAGTHRLSWRCDSRGRKLSPGAYFMFLDMGKEQVRLKVVVR